MKRQSGGGGGGMVLGAWKVWGKYHTDESDHARAAELKLEVCAPYSSLKCHSFITQRRNLQT